MRNACTSLSIFLGILILCICMLKTQVLTTLHTVFLKHEHYIFELRTIMSQYSVVYFHIPFERFTEYIVIPLVQNYTKTILIFSHFFFYIFYSSTKQKKQVSIIRQYYNRTPLTNPWHCEGKRSTSGRHLSKAASSLFPIKMIMS